MRKILALAVLCLCLGIGHTQDKLCKCDPVCKCTKDKGCGCDKFCCEIGDLSGYYEVNGVESSGKKYFGVCVVDKRADVYLLQWSTGGASFAGVGVRVNNNLAVGWLAPGPNNQTVRGVTLYSLKAKSMSGRWASFPGTGQVASETLTFLKELPKEE